MSINSEKVFVSKKGEKRRGLTSETSIFGVNFVPSTRGLERSWDESGGLIGEARERGERSQKQQKTSTRVERERGRE